MARNKSINIYRMKTDDDVKMAIRAIVEQLTTHGRAVTNNGKASRTLSRFLREPIQQNQIYFRKDLIVIPPSFKLVWSSDKKNKIKILVNKDFGDGRT